MNILHVISPGPLAGAERVVLGGAQAQIHAGAHAHIIVLHEDRCPEHAEAFAQQAQALGVPTHTLTASRRMDYHTLTQLEHALLTLNPDVLHVHGYKATVYTGWAASRRALWIASHHGNTSHDLKARVFEKLETLLYRSMDGVFAVSHEASRSLSKFVPNNKLHVLPNFIALEGLAPTMPRPIRPTRALFLGRLSLEKGVDVLLDSLASHWPSGLERVDIAGDGPERARLEQRAHDLHLPHVHFLGFQADVPKLLREHDLLLMPSLREGMPMSLLEALAAELPVLASSVGAIPDVANQGAPITLTRPGDAGDLSRGLSHTLLHIRELQRQARDHGPSLRQRYSAKIWAERSMSLYQQLTPRRKRGHSSLRRL